MFKCDITGKVTKLGEKCNKITTHRREKVYTHSEWVDGHLETYEVGKGWEIVKEIKASDEGLAIWNSAGAPMEWVK